MTDSRTVGALEWAGLFGQSERHPGATVRQGSIGGVYLAAITNFSVSAFPCFWARLIVRAFRRLAADKKVQIRPRRHAAARRARAAA
jgi:hypothetical protein